MRWKESLKHFKTKVLNNKGLESIDAIRKETRNGFKKLIRNKKFLAGASIAIGSLIIIYMIGVVYFASHFYWGTEINKMGVGGESLSSVRRKLENESSKYALELEERHNKTETIQGDDIGLTYKVDACIKKLKNEQGSWNWPWKIFDIKELEVDKEISYDKELLKDKVNSLKCITDKSVRAPEDASIKYIEGTYQIVEGDRGNTVDSNILYDAIVKAIMKNECKLSLDSKACYKVALYTKESAKLNQLKNQLNGYLNAQITYDFGDRQEVIDKERISTWLGIDQNMSVILNEKAIADYIVDLAKVYDTLGGERYFTASTGKRIKVVGGDYGWQINVQDEIGELIQLIKKGEPAKRIPLYTQTALKHGSNDIGTTYVEVNLSKQHLWFYKNGELIVQGDIVTGNLKGNCGTPQGTYTLDYKKANAVLRGPGYASPVKFWMPFNGGIGLHDANWRRSFGGKIYQTNGSHGCVNLPTSVAQNIFNNIDAGVPIVCYFDK